MTKIRFCVAFMAMFLTQQACFSAHLCAVLSNDSRWDGGVFSVITEKGQTIATTSVVAVGEQGCTHSFAAGTYLIRFTGVKNGEQTVFIEDIYGCLTQQSYVFDDASVQTVVFDHGRPPFNGNYFCDPV
jgi:hypothetical protein